MSKKSKAENTLDQKWCRENSDRLASFEILKRYVKHETKVPMSYEDLYDKIGVSKTQWWRLLQSLKERLNDK
jgi:hypothetical protein